MLDGGVGHWEPALRSERHARVALIQLKTTQRHIKLPTHEWQHSLKKGSSVEIKLGLFF
jgi:hypothetical protein